MVSWDFEWAGYDARGFPRCSVLRGSGAGVPRDSAEFKACFVVMGDWVTGFIGTLGSLPLCVLFQEEGGQGQAGKKYPTKDLDLGGTAHRAKTSLKQKTWKQKALQYGHRKFRGLKHLWSQGKDHFHTTFLIAPKCETESLAARVNSSVEVEVMWLQNNVQNVLYIHVTSNC